MKKIIYILFFIIVSQSYAQEFNTGTNVINAGIGFGGNFGNYTTSSQSPSYSIAYERGIWEVPGPGVVSLGAYLGTKTYKYNYTFGNDKWNYTIIGIRGAYHYNGLEIKNLDIYAGAMFSYNILSYKGSPGNFGSKPSGTAFAGGRWYFSKTFAAFAEAGYGVAYLNLGASIRF
ncbi:hypothetical protein [uncultured Maribacter sp.]|uniref:hypothetical protein n=1 Tax=uncultured Maribacter sp. TaxID=431308 RepID=UPI002620B7A6|nr:hypothetical protein [uncultured Maribacter sp.]